MLALEHRLVPGGRQDGTHRRLADLATLPAAMLRDQLVERLDLVQAHQLVEIRQCLVILQVRTQKR